MVCIHMNNAMIIVVSEIDYNKITEAIEFSKTMLIFWLLVFTLFVLLCCWFIFLSMPAVIMALCVYDYFKACTCGFCSKNIKLILAWVFAIVALILTVIIFIIGYLFGGHVYVYSYILTNRKKIKNEFIIIFKWRIIN